MTTVRRQFRRRMHVYLYEEAKQVLRTFLRSTPGDLLRLGRGQPVGTPCDVVTIVCPDPDELEREYQRSAYTCRSMFLNKLMVLGARHRLHLARGPECPSSRLSSSQ
ncbi:MAG: hypothetical protein V3S83_12490 [Gemmatimonadota bacterium]